jgi:smad nuclear-interacting protein 1
MSSHRSSRWGGNERPASSSTDGTNVLSHNQPAGSVSDAEALQALLSSAESREKEKSKQDPKRRSHHDTNNSNDRGSNNNNNNYNKRPRQENNRPGQQRLEQNNSYYGPEGGGGGPGGAGGGGGDPNQRRRRRNEESSSGPSKVEDEETNPPTEGDGNEPAAKPQPTTKPNFGLSGALMKDAGGGGNVYKGVVLKFREPPEARAPTTQWRFYVFKGKEVLDTLHISKQSAYLLGRNTEICDIPLLHPSLSGQHAVLQYRALPNKKDGTRLQCQPYIMDLESTNGTFLNGVKIDAARYYQLKKGDVVTLGASTREFVLMTENTTSLQG